MGHIGLGDQVLGGFTAGPPAALGSDGSVGPHRRDAGGDITLFYRGIAIGIAVAVPFWALLIWCVRII